METEFRRRYERVSFSVDLDVAEMPAGPKFRARSIDLSRGGVGFFARRFIPTGTRVQVAFHLVNDGKEEIAVVAATVMNTRMEGDGSVMGAAFDTPISPATQPALSRRFDLE